MTDAEKKIDSGAAPFGGSAGTESGQGAQSQNAQTHSGGCNLGEGAAGGADDGAACAGGVSFTEAGKRNLNFRWEVSGKPGAFLFFSRRAHPYSPPRRGGGISCGNRALCEANAAAAAASRQCHSACESCCHRLRRSQLFPFWKQSAPCPHKPATGSFICGYDPKLDFGSFFLCERETEKERMR